jgi:hypothetical protein
LTKTGVIDTTTLFFDATPIKSIVSLIQNYYPKPVQVHRVDVEKCYDQYINFKDNSCPAMFNFFACAVAREFSTQV